MDDVISLSSDDSDVEIVGSFTTTTKAEPLPLTTVRVDVDALSVNVPPRFIDLTDPKWTLPELKLRKRQNSTALAVVDLTESNVTNGTELEKEILPPDDCQIKKESANKIQISNKKDFNMHKSPSKDSSSLAPQQVCGDLKPMPRHLDPQTQYKNHNSEEHTCHNTPAVKLRRLPFLETHVKKLKTSTCSVHLTKDCKQMSLCLMQMDINSDASECICNFTRSTLSNGSCKDPSLDESPPKVTESPIRQEQQENSNEFISTRLCDLSDNSLPHSPANTLNPSKLFDLDPLSQRSPVSLDLKSQVGQTPISDQTPSENTSELHSEDAKAEMASNSPDLLHCTSPSKPPLSAFETEDMDEGSGTGPLAIDSPLSFMWQDRSDGEEMNEDSRFDMDFREASQEDRQHVCPVTLKKIMSGPGQALIDVEDEGFGTPEVLCRQSLSLVYSTIDENYPEGTLQLLSDLLQPGFYPPRDITTHLLRNILLDPQCPHHLCVQAFNLLMRTQRHHMADKATIPWDWELLTSVVAKQDHTRKHRCEVVRMFLEYVVQTLEDDFQAKRSASALHHSIAKRTISCDQQFPQVRDVIKWLFSAIMKSTENGERRETTREKDEHIRMVSIFQRMLFLALEVDRSPALSSAKLSQELFHMLISNVSLRAHRMLLLESLQSKLLRCKLLEHLLDYACPLKIALPMSLSLLLHFLKNCTLEPDPTDGTERWQRWEELVHLLWMLLLSYNKAMKGYLCSSVTEQRVGTQVYKPDDKVSKPAIRDAVDTFLSRSQADLGQALPLHVEESLTYLQDHLLDVCQC